MRILITGDRGYIGENLSRYLIDRGHSVLGVDKARGGDKYGVENIKDIIGYNCIVHLAAVSGVEDCEKNPDSAILNNILATLHLLKIAYNEIPVIFASSGAAQSPGKNFYAMTKKICEMEIQRLNLTGNLNNKILRFANVYGGMYYMDKKSSVMSKFIKGPIVVNGDGSQTRDFIHVEDVCEAVYLAITSKITVNIPLGIGTGINTSMLDLAKMFEKEYTLNPDSDSVGLDESPADVKSAERYLGFKAKINLEDYIRGFTEVPSPSVNTNSSTSNPSES